MRSNETKAYAHLVRGAPEEAIPRRILRLTGIAADALAAAEDEATVFERLRTAAEGVDVVVAHFARFEKSFVSDLWRRHAGCEPPFAWICTHALGRRQRPGLPSGSLRAFAGALGLSVPELKRAAPHVEATRFIWDKLVAEVRERQGLETLDALQEWLATPQSTPSKTKGLSYLMDRATRLALPDVPGVYKMIGPGDKVLYVGKATSLKSRVNSYFRQRKGHAGTKRELLSQVRDIQIVPCETALEAALLETDEIKRLDPPYNVALRASERQLGFLDHGLNPCGPDAAPVYGPYGTIDALLPLRVLMLAIESGANELLAALFYREVDAAVLDEGLATFLAEVRARGATTTARSLLALGIGAVRAEDADQEQDEGDEQDDDDPPPVVEPPLTADDVRRRLWGAVFGSAREHLRARTVRSLSDRVIAWRPAKTKSWRYLRLAGGEILERGDTKSLRKVASVAPSTVSWSIATYDRLRVLSTELARESKAGARIVIIGPDKFV